MSGPFDLRPVHVHGELLHARPTEWSHEDYEDPDCKSTRYESACPKCGQLIQFAIKDDVVTDSECAVDHEEADCPFWNVLAQSVEDDSPKDYGPSSVSIDISEKDVSSRSVKETIRKAAAELADKTVPRSLRSPEPANDDDDNPFQDPVVAGELKLSE